MSTQAMLLLCAVHSAALGVFHLCFWRLFDWNRQLAQLDRANRAIVQILNLRLTFVFFAVAALCLLYPDALASTPLGRALLVVMMLFWVGRTIEQFVFLRGLRHPAVHALTAVFVLGAVLFALPLWLVPPAG
ncbi:hypothetical protein E4582_00385 [Luteimonas yindakuii]|uniref:Uncharacterized protein n=1 Tax=Luteimonas yindakuii TaxID=2565782 RepID=A0A4Z1R354_9GAMM|nr:hypothetical protein [Luteimonas yindakuii]QCO67192.1 hypothetical protein E5843_04280 [Luteimonas yindakuii]TKS53376.1 hypothetical protein E4582_00385 [Luteimonas yindakuii]